MYFEWRLTSIMLYILFLLKLIEKRLINISILRLDNMMDSNYKIMKGEMQRIKKY